MTTLSSETDTKSTRQLLEKIGLSPVAAGHKAKLFADASKALASMGGNGGPVSRWWVPGRLEFLGKHTDYCAGRSILAAVERGVCFCSSLRTDSRLRIVDAAAGEVVELQVCAQPTAPAQGWALYPAAVARRLAAVFPGSLRGADVAFISDLPPAAGLSSSSCLIVGFFLLLAKSNGEFLGTVHGQKLQDRVVLGEFLGAVESGRAWRGLASDAGVGTQGGSQDQTAILSSTAGSLTAFDFFEARRGAVIKLPAELTLVIATSGVVARKTGAAMAAYNNVSQRAAACLACWRDLVKQPGENLEAMFRANPENFPRLRTALQAHGEKPVAGFSGTDLLARVEQFDTESHRLIPAAIAAMRAGRWADLGDIVDESQQLADTCLHNQVEQTRRLAATARSLGAVAACAFGAGFGGAVWALVETSRAEAFTNAWRDTYGREFPDLQPAAGFFQTALGPAAAELK